MTVLSRWHPSFAIRCALDYFGLPDSAVDEIRGAKGRALLMRLWAERGEGLYQEPLYFLRQEWFHANCPLLAVQRFCACVPKNALLLDFGCGTAEALREPWIDQGRRTLLYDLPGPLQGYLQCKYRGYKGAGSRLRAHRVEYLDPHNPWSGRLDWGGVDALMCLDVLEHVPEPLALVQRLWDCLTPGGQALILFDQSYPHPGHLKESIAQYPAYESWKAPYSAGGASWAGCDWLVKPKRRNTAWRTRKSSSASQALPA